jgi:hypothetical protein
MTMSKMRPANSTNGSRLVIQQSVNGAVEVLKG